MGDEELFEVLKNLSMIAVEDQIEDSQAPGVQQARELMAIGGAHVLMQIIKQSPCAATLLESGKIGINFGPLFARFDPKEMGYDEDGCQKFAFLTFEPEDPDFMW